MPKIDPLKGTFLPQPFQGWFEKVRTAINNTATRRTTAVENNIFVADADGDLRDSGYAVPLGTIIDDAYVGERYNTESELPEAGTEEGARPGSFRIGIFTEDDYAFFDESGKLILYGTAGIQLITPLNHSSDSNRFAVLDGSGNLKYRTAAELLADLSGDATAAFSINSQRLISLADPVAAQDGATKNYVDSSASGSESTVQDWAAERFITENLLGEAEVKDSPFVFNDTVIDDGVFVLPEITDSALGTVTIANNGTMEASAVFEIDSTGTINLVHFTSNIAINIADPGTDAAFNIGLGTSNPVICKNRLGGSRRPLLRLWYR